MDWIGVVEAAYRLHGSPDDWIGGVVEQAEAELDAGFGAYGYVFGLNEAKVSVRALAARGILAGNEPQIRVATEMAPIDAIGVMFASGIVAGSAQAVLAPVGLAEQFEQIVLMGTGGMVRDIVGVVARDGEGLGIALAGGRPVPTSPSEASVRKWTKAAAHIGAGCRLRSRLLDTDVDPDAVLAPDGRVVHAEPAAQSALDRLRDAAIAMDRARGSLRREDPEEALALWTGLVDGRWSLLDRFESDGRRFVVAHRNDPRVPDPRGLTPTELRAAELLGSGRTTKEIAYELGVSPSAVTNASARVRKKLGLESTPELVSFFAPGGIRARLARFALSGAELVVGSLPEVEERLAAHLSGAERDVALELLRGRTNESIAQGRGTSESTVANQVASIFRKLGVSSRSELAASIMG